MRYRGKRRQHKYLVASYAHHLMEAIYFFCFFSCKSVFGQFTARGSSFHSYSASLCEYDNVEVKEKSVMSHASEIIAGKVVGVFLFYFFTFESFSG